MLEKKEQAPGWSVLIGSMVFGSMVGFLLFLLVWRRAYAKQDMSQKRECADQPLNERERGGRGSKQRAPSNSAQSERQNTEKSEELQTVYFMGLKRTK